VKRSMIDSKYHQPIESCGMWLRWTPDYKRYGSLALAIWAGKPHRFASLYDKTTIRPCGSHSIVGE
jgi:hypothetical protein